jgi:oleate hydratase
MIERHADENATFYLVGAGIASLAAAAFLIRDGSVKGHNVVILEESAKMGGSLDAAGTPKGGYTMRGGRMFESKYLCTFDLFSSIPTLDGSQTVTEETFAWSRTLKTSSKARLVRDGIRITAPEFELSEKDILTIERLMIEPEELLGRSSIADQFDHHFFSTEFWYMWCTTFAFQPWHSAIEFKRYLVRFTHMISGFNSLSGIMRTVYNQFDSMVRPLWKWLEERGVQVRYDTCVTALDLMHGSDGYSVERLLYNRADQQGEIVLNKNDFALVTLGSMTEGSSLGSNDCAPSLLGKTSGGAWTLWESIADSKRDFGNPANFTDHIEESKWVSFTATLTTPDLFDFIRDLSGNAPGEGGLLTFPDSSWLLSIVLPHQPHFLGQPVGVQIFWGYGLHVNTPGDFVKKPMSECTGRELMIELLGHLHLTQGTEQILQTCQCIPCMMPFITSQFLRRSRGDRPEVLPERSQNLAFLGQFCEMPDDVVFTVEYSIRSAQTAVYALLGLERKPPSMYKGSHNPRVLLEAYCALHETAAR